MITDDLKTLHVRPDEAPMSLRQGVVESWDPDTGANTVTVAGGTLVNVPVLIGETVILNAGDVVALLTTGARWFLLGKVTVPGDPGTVPTWPGDIIDLGASVSALDAEIAVTQGQVDTLNNTTLPALTADLATAQADITAAQTDLNTAEAALVTAQSDIDAVEASVATLNNTTLPGLASDLDAAEASIATLNNTTLPALQTQVDGILPITETDISDDAITTPKIAANAITAAEIATDAVTAGKILAGSVTTAKLDVGAVTAAKIATGTITANELAAGAVTAVKIAANSITANEIAANAVTASELNAGAVTAGKIAADAVTANEIAAGAVTASELSAGAVTTTKLAAGAVTANEIAAGAITAVKLDAAAITGKTVTGGIVRTAASGQRVQMDSATQNQIQFFSGTTGETQPGYVATDIPSAGNAALKLSSPFFSSAPVAQLYLTSQAGSNKSITYLYSDEIQLNGLSTAIRMGTTTPSVIDVIGTLDAEAITATSIDLGSGTTLNDMYFGTSAALSPNASGVITINHPLGVVPTLAFAMATNSGWHVAPDTSTSTAVTFVCRQITSAGAPLVSTGSSSTIKFLFLV